MPRVARGLADGLIYHIINRGNGRQQVFHTDGDYRAFAELMAEASERYPVKVLAWCIMPNHFHLLVSPERADDLGETGTGGNGDRLLYNLPPPKAGCMCSVKHSITRRSACRE